MSIQELELPLSTGDGHRYQLIARIPARPRFSLLWLPALGVAARHYLPLADSLASKDVAVFLHEMRGNGSSSLRAGRETDWGYREILSRDVARSDEAVRQHLPSLVDEPRTIGGHSIGAQFAACYLALHPGSFQRLWLVASGSPYWRNFPAPRRYVFPFAFQFAPWLADLRGSLPGRQLGFGGDEARTLMRDWASVGLSNRYAAAGMDVDLEAALSGVTAPAQGVLMADDWFAPRKSLQSLLDKMPRSRSTVTTLGADELLVRADHFAWMKRPQAVANALFASASGDA
jgi:predicted alpha/beta hydrolase